MTRANHSEAPNGSPALAVGGSWADLAELRGGSRLAVRRTNGGGDWFVALNPQNEDHPAEGRWKDWVALARAILARDEERAARKVEP